MAEDRARWRVAPGTRVDLAALDPRATDGAPGNEASTEATFPAAWERLHELQERFWAERRRKLLVVLQGMDTSGKGGTIEHVFRGLDPAGVRVESFKAPTEAELARDFLWRVHRVVPAAGEIGVFDRSHYEDVLIVRVREMVPEEVWRGRYAHIRAFEQHLADSGTVIVKVYLHISKAEQGERLQARIDAPHKRWKFRLGDLDERARWDDYQAAYTDAIGETSTDAAPWYVVPADRKWYRNWAVLRIVIETLDELDPQWPEPAEDLSGVVIE